MSSFDIRDHLHLQSNNTRLGTMSMELIIKPTEACNFACTFCSSTNIAEHQSHILPLEQIFEFLNKFPNTSTIIVNGGDPLMMSPSYYKEILDFLDQKNLQTTLSFTTNLWAFFKNPDKWINLFKNPRVGVATSFNYGETRRVTKSLVYTEDLFWQVSNLFLERVGYRPAFISVINDENATTAIDNVKLAKQMGVECKLNYAMASGEQKTPYILAKIYKIYLEIIESGLTEWEFNSKQLLKRINKIGTSCPQNRSCDSSIRCLQPSGTYYSCGAFGDDDSHAIDFKREMESKEIFEPLKADFNLTSLKQECFTCEMFDICNGCKKTISDLKSADLVEQHCVEMKQIAPKILKLKTQKKYTEGGPNAFA